MKRFIVLAIFLLFGIGMLSAPAMAYQQRVQPALKAWSGNDKTGVPEDSLPVIFKIYNATTNQIVSQIELPQGGPVANLKMPIFTLEAQRGVENTFYFNATAEDSAIPQHNVSPPSANFEFKFVGSLDTTSPDTPIIEMSLPAPPAP